MVRFDMMIRMIIDATGAVDDRRLSSKKSIQESWEELARERWRKE